MEQALRVLNEMEASKAPDIDQYLAALAQGKRQYRHTISKLPFETKVEMVVRMREIAAGARPPEQTPRSFRAHQH